MNAIQKILYAELYRKSFYEFVKAFWSEADPSKFIDGKLVQFYCEVFQYFCKDWVGYTELDIDVPSITEEIDVIDVRQNKRNLNLNVPPRHSKSMIFNVLGPVWLWTNYPVKAVSVSHTSGLSGDMNMKRQKVINSEKFKELFSEINLSSNSNSFLKDTRGGELYSVNRNSFTGYGGDVILNDDLTNAETARKDKEEMNNAWSYYQNTMPSRINDINRCFIMNIQQRLAPNDITGHILSEPKLASQYCFVTLRAQFNKETYLVCPISGDIIHYNKGDFLWPERFGNYEGLRAQVGETIFQTQYLQEAIASDKTVIKENMLNVQAIVDVPSVDNADMVYVSSDFPVKDKDTSDYLGSILAYRVNRTLYIKECLEKHMSFISGVEYIEKVEEIYPGSIKICEDKANGSSTIQLLQDTVPGIYAFNPGTNSKMQRLESASFYLNNVVFIKDVYNKMTNEYNLSDNLQNLIHRLLSFPFVEHDDIVDAFSMLLLFVFLDRKYEVYGRAFNDENLVDNIDKYNKFESNVFINKEGDLWKTCEIAINYSEFSELIISKELTFRASITDAFDRLHKEYPSKSVFIDASAIDSLDSFYHNGLTIARYEDLDFEKSVVNLNKLFAANRIKVYKNCFTTRSDIEMFKYAKTKDDTYKFATEKDGMVSCIRIALKYYGIY